MSTIEVLIRHTYVDGYTDRQTDRQKKKNRSEGKVVPGLY
jgi:hypothetical protein